MVSIPLNAFLFESFNYKFLLTFVQQAESGYGSETHLPKVGSVLSLTSLPSLQSSSSFKVRILNISLLQLTAEFESDSLCFHSHRFAVI